MSDRRSEPRLSCRCQGTTEPVIKTGKILPIKNADFRTSPILRPPVRRRWRRCLVKLQHLPSLGGEPRPGDPPLVFPWNLLPPNHVTEPWPSHGNGNNREPLITSGHDLIHLHDNGL